jgi:hypothetical protein
MSTIRLRLIVLAIQPVSKTGVRSPEETSDHDQMLHIALVGELPIPLLTRAAVTPAQLDLRLSGRGWVNAHRGTVRDRHCEASITLHACGPMTGRNARNMSTNTTFSEPGGQWIFE